MRFLAHVRWVTTRSKLNPGLGRMLRDVGGYLRGGCALVAGEVDGSHAVPIPMARRHTSITICGGEQQVLRDKRAPLTFPLAAIHPVAGQILLRVDRPGEIDLLRGRSGFGTLYRGSHHVQRS